MTIDTIRTRLKGMQSEYERGQGALAVLQPKLDEAKRRHDELQQLLVQWELERLLLGKVSDLARVRIKDHIEKTVTAALQMVVGRGRFEIRLRDLGGQPAADWFVVSRQGDNDVVADPEDGRGGGVLDTVSIALRMCALELTQPKIDGPLILDEPGKHVSSGYIANLATFLRDYAERTGRQVIMVTHEDPIADIAHKAYRFRLNEQELTEVQQA